MFCIFVVNIYNILDINFTFKFKTLKYLNLRNFNKLNHLSFEYL